MFSKISMLNKYACVNIPSVFYSWSLDVRFRKEIILGAKLTTILYYAVSHVGRLQKYDNKTRIMCSSIYHGWRLRKKSRIQ